MQGGVACSPSAAHHAPCSSSSSDTQESFIQIPLCVLGCQAAADAGDAGAREAYLVAAARRRGMQAGVPKSLLRPILDLQSRILILGDPSRLELPDPNQAHGPAQAPLPPPERFVGWLLDVYDMLLASSLAPGYDADLAAELADDTAAAAAPAGQPGSAAADSRWWRPSAWADTLSTNVEAIAASALLHMQSPHRCYPICACASSRLPVTQLCDGGL